MCMLAHVYKYVYIYVYINMFIYTCIYIYTNNINHNPHPQNIFQFRCVSMTCHFDLGVSPRNIKPKYLAQFLAGTKIFEAALYKAEEHEKTEKVSSYLKHEDIFEKKYSSKFEKLEEILSGIDNNFREIKEYKKQKRER